LNCEEREENLIIGAKAERTIFSPIRPPTLPHMTVLANPFCKNSMNRSTFSSALGLRIDIKAYSLMSNLNLISSKHTPSLEKYLRRECSLLIKDSSFIFLIFFFEKLTKTLSLKPPEKILDCSNSL
jgi:hypothetical protein